MKKNYLASYKEQFGERWAKTLISGTSGFFIGTFEVILLPLDALKVKRQTGVQFMTSKPTVAAATSTTNTTKSFSTISSTSTTKPIQSIIPQNSFTTNARAAMAHQSPLLLIAGLYRGASWTAVRNSIGLFALFGSSTFVKEDLFGLGKPNAPPATVTQLFIASLVGAFSSIAVAAPFDVIKVRMQATSIDSRRVSGIELFKTLIKNEGVWALTKGVVPKMIASGPKVAFSFTVAQWLAEYFSRL
ncbi:mitochondrial carrier family putative [Obelidium mucronatum]|nr:mitochondrial carrier family putative [Obelidium mucronatum]